MATNQGSISATFYTGTANNSDYLGEVPANNYVNTSGSYVLTGVLTFNANLNINTTAAVIANGSVGTAGQVLTTNTTGVYWSTISSGGGGTVTSVDSSNGISGGPITSSGSLYINANTGIIANVTGVFVDSTYIGTLSANNTTYVNGKTEVNLNVNNSVTSNTANNSTYFGGYTWAAPAALGETTANTGKFTTVNAISDTATIQVGNATNYFSGNTTGFYPAANTLGSALGNTTARWVITGAAGAFSGTTSFAGLTVTGTLLNSGANGNYGSSTAASTYQLGYGATTTGVLKTINLGTGGAAGSTTNVNIGSTLSNTFVTINANTATVTGAVTSTRINPRIGTATGAASPITPTGDASDQYNITAAGVALTINAPSGTPVDGQNLMLRIKDNGTARALTWTTSSGGYRIIGTTLPTTTVINKTIYVGCIYNAADLFWDVISVNQQV